MSTIDQYQEFVPSIWDEQWHPHHAEILGAEGLSYGAEIGGEGLSFGEEIGVAGYGQSFGIEVGAQQDAVLRTVAQARDNRQPAPPMRALAVSAGALGDYALIGVSEPVAKEQFPLLASLLAKYKDGSAGHARIVRVDTEKSYKAFRANASPQRAAFMQKLAELEHKIEAHMADPHAHNPMPSEMVEDIEEMTQLGELVDRVEADKDIPLRMPRSFDGLLTQWCEGEAIGASMLLPRSDGGRWVVTSAEPLQTGVLEAAKAATEAGVRASDIVEYLPAIGASLSGANVIKDLAAGAESILKRPEAKVAKPFMVRLEPKASPALYALAALVQMCAAGNPQACEEWSRLASAGAAPVRQAMEEILAVMKRNDTSVGGLGSFFTGIWDKLRGLFGASTGARPMLPAAPAPASKLKALPAKAAA